MQKGLEKSIVQVISANVFNLAISLVSGFIMPKYLPISAYAQYKTFFLYTSYAGICHLGFIDGVYIKYGGKELSSIEKKEFSQIQTSLTALQILIAIIGISFGLFIGDNCLALAALCVVPINLQMLYKLVFQATGEFAHYKRILNVQALAVFIFNLILLIVLRAQSATTFLAGYFVITTTVTFFYLFKMRNMYTLTILRIGEIIGAIKRYVASGFVLMVGNFFAIWIMSIDRWFVKFLCEDDAFAYYSFSVSVLKFANAFLSAFSITLYNYFCINTDSKYVARIRRLVIATGSVMMTSAFIFRMIIRYYLPQYILAEKILVLLTASQLFVIIINAIYLNLYKALKMQRQYLKIIIEISLAAVILNTAFGAIWGHKMISYASATVFTMILWLLRCQIDLSIFRISIKEILHIIIILSAFILLNYTNLVLGFILYGIVMIICALVFCKNEVKLIIAKITRGIHKNER